MLQATKQQRNKKKKLMRNKNKFRIVCSGRAKTTMRKLMEIWQISFAKLFHPKRIRRENTFVAGDATFFFFFSHEFKHLFLASVVLKSSHAEN